MHEPIYKYALIAAFGALCACAGGERAQPDEPNWTAVSKDASAITLERTALNLAPGTHVQADGGIWVGERAQWGGSDSPRRASLHLTAISSHSNRFFMSASRDNIASEVRAAFSDGVTTGEPGSASNDIGAYEFLRFSRDDTSQCVYVRQYFDRGTSSQYRGTQYGDVLGKKRIRGYYCQREEPLDDKTLAAFTQGYSVNPNFRAR